MDRAACRPRERQSRLRVGLALLAAAALLALAAPAQAQTEIWSATLTPGNLGSLGVGCNNNTAGAECSSTAVLSDGDFTYASTDYAVFGIQLNSFGALSLYVDNDITTATAALTLVIGSTAFGFADADTQGGNSWQWFSAGVSLTVGTAVRVGLISTPADPDGVTVPALACDSDSNADNVLALVETSRHDTLPCAVSDDGQIRAIWTSEGSALFVEKADEGDDEPTLGNSPELRFTGEVERRTKPDLHRFSCETLSGFGRVWHTSDAADHVISVDCGQAPPPPSLEQVTGVTVAPGNGQLVVTWTAVANATGYTVQWRSLSQRYNTGDRQATVTSGSTTRHTIDSLVNGTEYTVQVIATRTGAADGPPSAEMTGTPRVQPPPPPPPPPPPEPGDGDLEQVTGVGVVPGDAQLVVTWTAVDDATGYTVQWRSGSQGYNTGDRQATVTPGSTTRHTIPGLANGTEYTVRVIATGTSAADGPPSAEMTGTPAAPGVTVSKTALTVAEEDTTGDSYTVVLDTRPTANVLVTVAGHAGTDVTPTPGALTFTAMDWETARTVTVTAGNDADTADDSVSLTHGATSPDSGYEGITIAGVAVTVNDNDTAQVMGVGVAPGNAQLVVTWTAVDDATGYTVQWRSGSQGYDTGDRQATVTPGSTTSHTIDSLVNGTEYTVRVIATRTGANDGPPSAEMTGTPTAEPMPVPALPMAGAIALGLLLLGTGRRALRRRARG